MKVTKTIFRHNLNNFDHLDDEQVNELKYGGITFSHDEGGCNLDKCECSEGYWVKIDLPLDKSGNSETILIEFNNEYDFFTFKENSIL